MATSCTTVCDIGSWTAWTQIRKVCLGVVRAPRSGSLVFGHGGFDSENVYIVPGGSWVADLGVMPNVVSWKALYKVFTGRPSIEKGYLGIRKARVTSPEQGQTTGRGRLL